MLSSVPYRTYLLVDHLTDKHAAMIERLSPRPTKHECYCVQCSRTPPKLTSGRSDLAAPNPWSTKAETPDGAETRRTIQST